MVSEGHGSWLEYLEFDGKVYWTINDEPGTWKNPDDPTLSDENREYFLHSDSIKRTDRTLMIEKNFVQAEKDKFGIEEEQRKDKLLRKAAAKKHKATKK